jgi:Tetratricopeptide repeat
MKTMFADFNAMTEAGHVSLSTRGSQEDIERCGSRPGDWAWLSDGELILGAQIAIDDRYGLVGVPDWDTLVHLDGDDLSYDTVSAQLNHILTREPHSIDDEPEVFQLVTQLEWLMPNHIKNGTPGMLAFRRALSLRQMDKLGLAILEMEEARRECPDNHDLVAVYLELIRREDLPSAVAEAEALSRALVLPAVILSACINILAAQAEQTSDDQFQSMAERVFALCQRFDQAPDLASAGDSLIALSHFNRGMVHLRAGRISQARRAFETAQRIYPVGPMFDQIAQLQTYDQHARKIASRVRAIAERWEPSTTAAA